MQHWAHVGSADRCIPVTTGLFDHCYCQSPSTMMLKTIDIEQREEESGSNRNTPGSAGPHLTSAPIVDDDKMFKRTVGTTSP